VPVHGSRPWPVLACFCVSAALGACGGAGESPRRADTPAVTPAALTERAPNAQVVRSCDAHHTGVGFGGVSAESQRQALRVGPLSLGSLRTIRLSQLPALRPGQQRVYPLESIAVIDAGAVATVAVPASERRFVGLIYDQDKFRPDGRYRLRDLDWVVRFEACQDPSFNHGLSQYDGGVVVAGRRCFHLDFWTGSRSRKVRRRVPAGGRCAPQ
jgi:hypothetical protein